MTRLLTVYLFFFIVALFRYLFPYSLLLAHENGPFFRWYTLFRVFNIMACLFGRKISTIAEKKYKKTIEAI